MEIIQWTIICICITEQLFYTTYISVDLAHQEIFRAKIGKGGITNMAFALTNGDNKYKLAANAAKMMHGDKHTSTHFV